MNQRSTNRSFDAAMRLFKTRQRLEGGGVGENEGDRPTLGGVGGLALGAGLGLGHSGGHEQVAHQARNFLSQKSISLRTLLGLLNRVSRVRSFRVLSRLGRVNMEHIGLAPVSGTNRQTLFVQQEAVSNALKLKAGVVFGGENGAGLRGHGGSKSGPIPAISNPKPVTSDESSTFFGRIMNGPIPYEPTPEGRAIAAAYKKRQEGEK